MVGCKCLQAWLELTSKLQNKIARGLGAVGHISARRPCATLLLCLLLTVLCGAGFLRFEVETKGEKLWVPQKSEAYLNKEYVDDAWGFSNFPLRILIEAKDRGQNALTPEIFRESFDILDDILALHSEGATYRDICQRDTTGECVMIGPLGFFGSNRTTFESQVDSQSDLLAALSADVLPTGERVDRETIFGSLETSGSQIASSPAWRLYLMVNGSYDRDVTIKWEKVVIDEFVSSDFTEVTQKWEHMHVQVQAAGRSVDDELQRSISGDVIFLVVAYSALLLACAFMLGNPLRCVQGRRMLGACDFFLVLFAMMAGYGLSSAFGVPFTSLQQILPFILVGIGVDNAFVIASAFDRTDKSKPVEEGMSVTLTSFTDIIAFLAGSTASFPAVRYFCIYAGLSLFFVYIFHITAFCAMLALDHRRQRASRLDVLCCFRACSAADGAPGAEEVEGFGHRLMEKHARAITSSRPLKLAIIAVFGGYAGFSLWMAIEKTDTNFKLMSIAPDDSYVRNFLTAEEKYWEADWSGHHLPVELYLRDVDGDSADTHAKIMSVEDKLLAVPCINEEAHIISWHRQFTTWATNNKQKFSAADFSVVGGKEFMHGPGFIPALQSWLSNCSLGCRFRDDVVIESGVVQRSRVTVRQRTLLEADEQGDCLTEVEAYNEEASGILPGTFAFTQPYIFYHQYRVIRQELFWTTGMCFIAVVVVALVILGHPVAVSLIVGVILLVFIDLLGAVPLAGVSLNSVSMINLVMAIGLVVDYSMHIVHNFMVQDPHLSRDERVVLAMKQIGLPVVKGIVSTFIAVAPIGFASSEVFRIFFKMFLAILIVGGSHGLVLMPVLLSIVGPCRVDDPVKTKAQGDAENEVPSVKA